MISTNWVPMDVVAGVLSQQVGRPVIDKAGLGGNYEFFLTWADPNAISPAELKAAAMAEGRSLFTALQEELGLRLEAQRGPVEMIVVEHVESRPQTEDSGTFPGRKRITGR